MPPVSTVQDFKDAFFTSEIVQSILGPAEKRALGKMGGYVRRVARNSLKYGETSSAPGKPPTVHQFFTRRKVNRKTGAVTAQSVSPLKELLFYAFDATARSTVVGPAIFGSSARQTKDAKPIPGTIEKGGAVSLTRILPLITNRGRPAGPRQKESFLRKVRDGSIVTPTQTLTVTKTYLFIKAGDDGKWDLTVMNLSLSPRQFLDVVWALISDEADGKKISRESFERAFDEDAYKRVETAFDCEVVSFSPMPAALQSKMREMIRETVGEATDRPTDSTSNGSATNSAGPSESTRDPLRIAS